jgi:hypothetical protein
MSGGILAVFNDLDAACDRAAYEFWYQTDHMPDRLAVPGFRHARRYRRIDGAAQDYFTFYETESVDVLRSDAYRARLAAPTEGTQQMMRHFRAMSRSVCQVAFDADVYGAGGAAGYAAVIGAVAPVASVSAGALRQLVVESGVMRARVWVGATDLPENPEAALRQGTDVSLGAIAVAEDSRADVALRMARALGAELGIAATPTLYGLLYASR